MQRRSLKALFIIPAVAALLAGGIPAHAAEDPIADDPGYVIVDLDDAVSTGNGQVFYPTGLIDDDTIVIIPDASGALPNGLTEALLDDMTPAQRTQALSPNAGIALAATYAYGATSTGWSQAFKGGSFIGLNDSTTAYYGFNVSLGTSQRNAGQGLGYYRGYNGSEFGTWSSWYNLGTASSQGDGGASVPWGNVASNKQFRATCATSTLCGGYFW